MTRLDRPLKREIDIKGEAFVVNLSPENIKLTRKGHRNGIVLGWNELVSGDAAIATALNAAVAENEHA